MSLPETFAHAAVWTVLLGATLALPARAQVLNSAAKAITLQAVLSESLTVTLSGSSVNFTLKAGGASNPGSGSVTATTSWTLSPSRSGVNLYAYFTNSGSALTDGAGDNIPSADFQVSDNAGPFNALTNTVPFGGANAGLLLWTTPITGTNKTGTHTDAMNFNINLTALPNLPAATYTGTLTIQAQAN